MKRFLLFFLILIAQTYSFSQTTSKITITDDQLRVANLIFVEHKKFSEEIPLLKKQIINLESLDLSWQKSDSIKSQEIQYYKYRIIESDNSYNKLEIKTNKYKTATIVLSSSLVIAILTFLLVK